jgi:transcriptional regulator GlxA family with amidase domain
VVGHNQRVNRNVVIVAYPGVQVLDVVGPLEVFARADRWAVDAGMQATYRPIVATASGGAFATPSGLTIVPECALREITSPVHTVVIAGGEGTPAAAADRELLDWLRAVDAATVRTTSVCSGAFVLAAAGLLDGRTATTHWSECDRLARLFPRIVVESDPIFVRDGKYMTSAGVTAGMDLALAIVEEDLGRDAALYVARWLVLFVHRPGGQAQFSAQLSAQAAQRGPIRDLQQLILEQPASDLSVAAMARLVAMSERNFARVFANETGVTPAEYVERVRVETARRLLEQTSLSLDDVAAASGFGSTETLRRSFHRQLAVSPSDYRSRFRAA